ncbi:MAG: transglutaminase-like domain-containing protein [Anaerolineales bacterium]
METSSSSQSEVRWWDPLAAVLLICVLLTAAARLIVTQWTDGLDLVRTLAVLGAILGLVLGQTRFSPRTAVFFGVVYGIFLIPWQLGLTLAEDILWKERVITLSSRLGATLEELLRSKAVSDNILFLFLMACVYWGFSLHAGYTLTRHANAWRAALPIGFTAMIIQAYDPLLTRRAGFLAALLLFAILLVARMNFIQRRANWKTNRTYIPPDIGYDWIRFTLVVAILIVAVAWTVPVLADTLPAVEEAWQQARKPWVELQDRMSNLFGTLQASVGIYNEYYTDTFSLGLGSPLTDEPVLAIQAPPRGFPGLRFYWRAYAYDQFADGRWLSTANSTINMGPEDPILSSMDAPGRLTASFVFTPQNPIATLFTAPQPLWVSLDATAHVNTATGGSPDIVAIEANRPVFRGDGYEVRSSLAAATEMDIRQAGTDYPEWVTERYLQLPDDITPRTIELAQRISENFDNPYDIAVAITEYLRTYEYSEIIDAPPLNQEVVDWWLFDYGKGFCQYYATSQVILLRILGIPARYAVGYAEGELQGEGDEDITGMPSTALDDFVDVGGTYVVRQRDSHAWPEVYFPEIGWVEFEPTASQLRIFRPSGVTQDEAELTPAEVERDAQEQAQFEEFLANQRERAAEASSQAEAASRSVSIYLILLVTLVIIFVVVVAWRKKRSNTFGAFLPIRLERGLRKIGVKSPKLLRRWVYFASLDPIARSYMEINRALKRLGKPAGVHDTPAERAAELSSLLPEVEQQVHFLLEKYQLSIYSQRIPDVDNARQFGLQIRSLSYRAMLRNLMVGLRKRTANERLQSLLRSP